MYPPGGGPGSVWLLTGGYMGTEDNGKGVAPAEREIRKRYSDLICAIAYSIRNNKNYVEEQIDTQKHREC